MSEKRFRCSSLGDPFFNVRKSSRLQWSWKCSLWQLQTYSITIVPRDILTMIAWVGKERVTLMFCKDLHVRKISSPWSLCFWLTQCEEVFPTVVHTWHCLRKQTWDPLKGNYLALFLYNIWTFYCGFKGQELFSAVYDSTLSRREPSSGRYKSANVILFCWTTCISAFLL